MDSTADIRYVLDTDVVLDHLNGIQSATDCIDSLPEGEVALSVITFGEVLEGALGGRGPAAAVAGVDLFRENKTLLDVTVDIARIFAQLRCDLRQRGRLIPDSDLLIAATALHHDATLVTRNTRHFERIPDLTLMAP